MKTGIWLDKEKAHIVTLQNGEVSFNTILSNVENFHIHGGSGTRLKGGPQDVVQDSKYLEREKHQLKKYFNEIVSEIKDSKELVLLGPAQTSKKLQTEISNKYPGLKTRVKDVVKTDSMSKSQLKAWVKDFFKSAS